MKIKIQKANLYTLPSPKRMKKTTCTCVFTRKQILFWGGKKEKKKAQDRRCPRQRCPRPLDRATSDSPPVTSARGEPEPRRAADRAAGGGRRLALPHLWTLKYNLLKKKKMRVA